MGESTRGCSTTANASLIGQDRRLSGLAGPDYDATISFGLPFEPEDSQYGKYRLDFRNYRHMVHEAGHALGLSNYHHLIPFASSAYHPSIPDSVMNYDHKVPQISNEPDCSPHPFDIMAIGALYQTAVS